MRHKLFKKTCIILGLALGLNTFVYGSETQTITSNQTVQTTVTYSKGDISEYNISIPKTIEITSESTVEYTITVDGKILSNDKITVTPDETVLLKDQAKNSSKKDIEATVEQEKTEWVQSELGTSTTGSITVGKISAGAWKGQLNFNITLEEVINNLEFYINVYDSVNEATTYTYTIKEGSSWSDEGVIEKLNSQNKDVTLQISDDNKLNAIWNETLLNNDPDGKLVSADETIEDGTTYYLDNCNNIGEP